MEHLTKINKTNNNDLIDITNFNEENYLEYDYYRIVNPITKEVFKYENKKLTKIPNFNCYDIWQNGKSCDYCVSANALVEGTSKKKLEQINGELFMAKVFPIMIEEKKYIIELFQNIGESYIKTDNSNVKLSELVSQMNHLATIESFSGLYSHGFMFNKTMEITRENILPVSLLCMDIDKMKFVNDTFGHFEGDRLIKAISNELIKLNSNNIFAGRTGGDEFQVIFVGYNEKDAFEYSKNILKNLEKIPIKENYFGSTSWAIGERKDSQSPKDFLDSVDAKMYVVKAEHHAVRED